MVLAERKVPVRRCVGCGEGKPKKELMRMVRTAEGEVSLDATGRKAGRGAYVCHNAVCLAKARKKKSLERAFGVAIPPEVYDALAAEMPQAEDSGDG
jgi:predicted RNA-binding protein YlxR (DUF448 family)